MYDYKYTNNENPFAVVKFDLDGNFVTIDCDPSESQLLAMENMTDVEGWEISDII
jgi:hypothetical protein